MTSSRQQFSTHSPWSCVMTWTGDLVDRLKELWNQGFTAAEICYRLGTKTRNAIIGKANRLRNGGADIKQRTTAHRQREPKLAPKRIRKKSTAPAVKRRAVGRSGKRSLMPPSSGAASPPPILQPIEEHNGWKGLVAEVSYLKSKQCKWPLGDPVTGFCRAPLDNIYAVYCDYHVEMARAKIGKRAGE